MHIERYDNPRTKEVTYTFRPPVPTVRVDKLFIDSMDGKALAGVETEVANKLFHKLLAQLQSMHKNGELPLIEYKGGDAE